MCSSAAVARAATEELINNEQISKAVPGGVGGNSDLHRNNGHILNLADGLEAIRGPHPPPDEKDKLPSWFSLEEFAAKYDADYKPNSYGWSEWSDRQEIIREVAAQSRAAWLAGSTLSRVRSSWENPATVDVEQTHEKRENV